MKSIKKVSIAALGMLAILGTSVCARTGTVDAQSGLVLREKADKTSNPVTTVPNKAQVEIVEENGEWYKVTYNSQEGYLFGEYVDVTDTQETSQTSTQPESGNTQTINGNIKVYAIPLITSTVINEIQSDATITIEKRITNWCYVSTGEIVGWVRSYGLENTVQTNVEPESQELPEDEPASKPEEQSTTKPEDNTSITTPESQETNTRPQEPETNSSENSNTLQPSNSAQTEKPTEETKAFVDVDFANIRKEASTNSEIVTTLTEGTSFIITAETEEWYKIRYTSIDDEVYEGYIFKELTRK